MLVFVEGGKTENLEKNPRSKDENQQQTQPTYDAGAELNPGHIDGRRAFSLQYQPCSQYERYLTVSEEDLFPTRDVGKCSRWDEYFGAFSQNQRSVCWLRGKCDT